jgi:hypothetical protein
MNEKEKIEKVTAEKFIKLYNDKFSTSYSIKESSDNPDILCEDLDGTNLSLEITLTEDRDYDIKSLLGRSEHRDLAYVKKHGMGPASALSDNVLEKAHQAIIKKMYKDYGKNVALIIRDVSPVGWDWNDAIVSLASKLTDIKNPFDKGIWLITCHNQNRIYRVTDDF